MPERADSIGYGTRTRSPRLCPVGTASPGAALANSHTPLRFCHLSRVSWGRGYSGRALSGPTLAVQGVAIGGMPGCQTGAADAGAAAPATSRAATERAARCFFTRDVPFGAGVAL